MNWVHLILALASVLLTAFLIPLLKTKTTLAQRERLALAVRTLVEAAEKLYGDGKGADKLAYVAGALAKRGLEFDWEDTASELRSMIEAAVLELEKEAGTY